MNVKKVIQAIFIMSPVLSVGLLVGCKNNKVIDGKVEERDLKIGASPEETGDVIGAETSELPKVPTNEGVSFPGAITGAFLSCPTVEARDKVQVTVACHFRDGAQQRVPVRKISASETYSIQNAPPAGITVTILPADANYDVYFVFSGAKFAELNAAVQTTIFQVELTNLANGTTSQTVGGAGVDLAQPPAPRWPVDPTFDKNGNKLCDAGEACAFIENGIVWLNDSIIAKTYQLAYQECQKATIEGKDNFRLPTQSELLMAFEKNIGLPRELRLVDAAYWVQDAVAPTEVPAAQMATVNPMTGRVESMDSTIAQRFLCVHNI